MLPPPRISHPDEQAITGFTERASLATRAPFGAPYECDGFLISEVGAQYSTALALGARLCQEVEHAKVSVCFSGLLTHHHNRSLAGPLTA